MKRLLKISFDNLLISVFPILSWFALSIIVDKNLINVFSLTYPLQFVGWTLLSIFGTGANINKEKEKDNNSVMSGITIGAIVGFLIFGFIVINIENYINFMNMNPNLYKEFAIYSIVQIYTGLLFNNILEKLYFEGKNTKANKYSITYNLVNFIALIIVALAIKEKATIVIITSIIRIVCVLIMSVRNFDKFKLKFNILKYIKYESENIFRLFMLFLTCLIGMKVAFKFGEQYIVAITFMGIISDTGWDILVTSIMSAAKIDISKNIFNYKEQMKNAYKLCGIIIIVILTLALVLWQYYELPIAFTIILIFFEIYSLSVYPIRGINTSFIQLEYSAKKATINQGVASTIRLIGATLLNTPYCTIIGSTISSTYEIISTNIILKKRYKINKNGELEKIKYKERKV